MALDVWSIRDKVVSPEVARMVAYCASNGGNGIIGFNDFMVLAQPTPNGTVRILPGAGTAVSRFPAASYQSYAIRSTSTTTLTITPTGSTGGRTDYVIVRVYDDQYAGSLKEVRFETVQSLANINYPYILLAKITIPASTGTITQDMINTGPGVREMANPRSEPMSLAWNGRMDTSPNIKQWELTNRDGNPQYWMPYAVADSYFRWEVPTWATQFNYQYTYGNVYNNRYDCWGFVNMRMVLMEDMGKWVNLANIDFDTTTDSPGQWSRDTWTGAGRINIPSWARGKTVSFRPIAAKVGGRQAEAKIYLGAGASISMNGVFMESAISEIL